MEQELITPKNQYIEFDQWIERKKCNNILLVCDNSIRFLTEFKSHLEYIENKGIGIVYFSDFQPNPLYKSIVEGVRVYRDYCCDGIVAVGGGSAIDVAKCIKLYAKSMGNGLDGSWLINKTIENSIPFLVIPTTAGTGSEATRYAVIYYNDVKQSITSDNIIPETVLMDPNVLNTLPIYQKKATMMDAFCHSIESFWSVNSTEESRQYSKNAIKGFLKYMEGYLANTGEGNAGMLRVAHLAGKAINITQTTAGHAMCYKLTSLFGCAHGHAAILCDRVLFPWMIDITERCIDPRGERYLIDILNEIGETLGCKDARSGAHRINTLFNRLNLEVPSATKEQFEILKNSVNSGRLKNHPIALDADTIDSLYHIILNGGTR